MDRRHFLGIVGVPLAAVPRRSEAAWAAAPVVGVLNQNFGPPSISVDSLRRYLGEIGYVEGQTLTLEVRFAGGKPEAFPALALELAQRNVDVFVAIGPAALRAARAATTTIPIIAVDLETDPVEAGYARSIAHPGGNITGLFLDLPGLTGKWLELIKETAPTVRRVAILWDSATGSWQLAAAKKSAQKIGLEVQVVEVRVPADLGRSLETSVKSGSRALVELSSPLLNLRTSEQRVAAFALEHRLPAISMFRSFAAEGGLLSYGPDQQEYFRRLAVYVDKILKGAKPADLPIEQPTKFHLVVNLQTAKKLRLTIPQSLLVRADEAIQ